MTAGTPTPAPARRWFGRWHALAIAGLSRVTVAIWLFVLLVLAAIVLNFVAKPTVEFSLYAQAEGFSFVTRGKTSTNTIKLRSAEILSAGQVTVDDRPVPIAGASRVKIVGVDGDLTLSDISVGKGWTVSVQGQESRHLLINANPAQAAEPGAQAEASFVAGTGAELRYVAQDGSEKALPLQENAEVAIRTGTLSIDLDTDAAKILQSAEVSALSLTRDTATVDEAGRGNIVVEGTVASGKLWREYAAGETELGPLDQLTATAIEGGVLRNVVWRDGAIGLAAHGDAGRLSNRIGETARDLRPSILTVLRELGLFQVILAIFTFVSGLELTAFIGRRK